MLISRRWLAENCRFAAGYSKPGNAFELASVVINNSNHLDAYSGVARAIVSFSKAFESMMNGPIQMPKQVADTAMTIYTMRVEITRMIQQLGKARESRMMVKPLREAVQHLSQLAQDLMSKINSLNFNKISDPRQIEPGTFDGEPSTGWAYEAPGDDEPAFWGQSDDAFFQPPKVQPPAPAGGMKSAPQPKSAPRRPQRPRAVAAPRPVDQGPGMFATDVNYVARSSMVPALQEVIAATKKALAFKWADPDVLKQNLLQYFEAGKGGMNWYHSIHDLLVGELGPKHASVFIDFLAATSPRMPVERNVRLAIELYKKFQTSDKNFASFMSTHVPNIEKAWAGEELSGNKVKSFAANLKGDGNAVTLDTWMKQAFGIASDGFLAKEKLYEVAANACRELAAELGVEPRQFQAAVWTGIKTQLGPQSLTAQPVDEVLANEWELFQKHKKTKPQPQQQQQSLLPM